MTDEERDEVRNAARIIINCAQKYVDLNELNTFLAELEPYPYCIIRVEDVK